MMKKIWNKYQLALIGAVIGGVAGYFYWLKIGCASGTCAITSSPMSSVVWFALMGALLFDMFKKKEKKDE